jgi:hypothetical protein
MGSTAEIPYGSGSAVKSRYITLISNAFVMWNGPAMASHRRMVASFLSFSDPLRTVLGLRVRFAAPNNGAP